LLNVENDRFSFGFEFLNFFLLLVLLLLVLRLLEGACVITPLPANSAEIGGEPTAKELGTSRPKRFQSSFFLSLFCFFFSLSRVQRRWLKTLEVAEYKKNKKICSIAHRPPLLLSSDVNCNVVVSLQPRELQRCHELAASRVVVLVVLQTCSVYSVTNL
jgi:hypothetical protein